MDLHAFLQETTQRDGISGFEKNIFSFLSDSFSPYIDESKEDHLGNLILYKKGRDKDAPSILLCAHMDEIGLIVSKIEDNGFLRFTSLGGFDTRTLPGQAVTVYGLKALRGIIGCKPPHLRKTGEKGSGTNLDDLFVDTGLPAKEVKEMVRAGSLVAIERSLLSLLHSCRAGKALDDRAGVALLWQCARELKDINHRAHLYFVATVQEEVGTRGGVVSAYGLSPDIGIAVDVCHGNFPGAAEHEVSSLGKGPVITRGPNIHPLVAQKLTEVAEEQHLPYQKDVSPGVTGTDARALQVSREGIPTGLLSIPLRYMHTSVELVDMEDIKIGGKLLAAFVSEVDSAFAEELSCL